VGSRLLGCQQRQRVTDEIWVEYIKNQTPPEPDDNLDDNLNVT
jgi:hypothetical protein